MKDTGGAFFLQRPAEGITKTGNKAEDWRGGGPGQAVIILDGCISKHTIKVWK